MDRTRAAAATLALALAPAAHAAQQPADDAPEPHPVFRWPARPLHGPLVADRPDFTESVDAVPRGRVQIESGYTFTTDKRRGERTSAHEAPELLFRIGLFDDLELRLEWPGYVWTRAGGATDADAADPTLGVKWKLLDEARDGALVGFGVIVQTSVPAATDDGATPELKLLWDRALMDRLDLGGNVNIGAPKDGRGRYAELAASLALGFGLTERIGLFAEYYGFYPLGSGRAPEHYVNGGVALLVHDNLQFDARVGAGLNDSADDFFVGAGVSVRF